MRVLWFTNTFMPDAAEHLGRFGLRGSGWWMSVLLDQLKRRAGMQLAVVTAGGQRDHNFTVDGVDYFVVRTPIRKTLLARLGCTAAWKPSKAQIAKYAAIVRQWNPDVIHVHGTEKDYGLIKAWRLVGKPVAVSIQGLMTPCARKAYGDLLPVELHSLTRRAIPLGVKCLTWWKWLRTRMPIEEAIVRSADMVFGRTEWDHAWAWVYNPEVKYRHVDELMRREFVQAPAWSVDDCRRHQVFCTSGGQPLKGLHVLLEAVYRLRTIYSEIKLSVASDAFLPKPNNDYARFIMKMVRRWGLQDIVTFLGLIDAEGIIEQLKKAHCFVTPSFVENGCNALQEAMLVGTPCVATLSGGLTTTVESERTALTFPVGDAAVLARQIHRLFQDDALAVRLGAAAAAVARARHSPEVVMQQLIGAYEELVGAAVPVHSVEAR